MNAEEVKTKVNSFIEGYFKLVDMVENLGDDGKKLTVSIDDDYELRYEQVETMRSGVIAIYAVALDEPMMYYILDEDWTIGDLLGGYMDLIFKG